MALAPFIAFHLARWRNRVSPSSRADAGRDPRQVFGWQGETLAARFLRRHGCRILYRRFRAARGGEVDIVCRDGDTLVFVEVKTRASVVFGWPIEAVNAPKERLIARGALAWRRMLDYADIPFRFDVMEVVIADGQPAQLYWIREAFTLPSPYIY